MFSTMIVAWILFFARRYDEAVEQARLALERDPDYATAQRILQWARTHDTVIQVGHSERFNPVVQALTRMQVTPKFIETHRISPFTFRSADVGVVFDMVIHDIDIVLHMIRERRYTVHAVGVNVM